MHSPHPARIPAASICSRAVALLAGCAFCAPGWAQEIDEDFESRVDYAFYTENSNTLRNLITTSSAAMDKSGGSTAGGLYDLAYAYYRHGALVGDKSPSAAAREMSKCVDVLDKALESAPGFAEGYALQSICYGRLASLRTMTAMINGPRSGSKLARAQELAPRNPRVVLADALADYWRPRAFGGNKDSAVAKLRAAIALFEQEDPAPQTPRWGLSDAYFLLGQALYDAEDMLGARNALERALLVAPGHAAARRTLARITTKH